MATRLDRRSFLRSGVGTAASWAAGGTLLACGDAVPPFVEDTAWRAGDVAHLLPTVGAERIRLKASVVRTLAAPPRLRVAGREAVGTQTDSAGRFFAFDVPGLEPATEYVLELVDAAGSALCDPWPLRTFPATDAVRARFRLLAYTCAGGSDLFWHPRGERIFQPTAIRQRLLARALSFAPDAVVANGDHVYWDIRSLGGIAMGRSPQAWWTAGRFDRAAPLLGTENEAVLKAGLGPQIAGLYGGLFRSVPVFFLQDDHDYSENDEADEELRTFPADAFMLRVADATQRLYYPELPAGTAPARHRRRDGTAASYGALRYGRLFEGLLYDCRREITNAADPATGHASSAFVPPDVEAWLLERTRGSDATHLAHLPSTPILWTAGKWGEWYPDFRDPQNGQLSLATPKPFWPAGWKGQHDRLLAAASQRRDRTPLWVSGDLHATAAGRVLRTGEVDLSANPVVSVLSGTPGTEGPGWPSRFRGTVPRPSLALEAEEWLAPLEQNGFTLLDFDKDGVKLAFFRWRPGDGVDAISRLQPFREIELPRPG